MPVFELPKAHVFPEPELADPSGILAVGGDLSPQRLLLAYQMGIFPWFNEGDPIVWWSPDPRMVLIPNEVRISHSMKKVLRENFFTITCDTDFKSVVTNCQKQQRPGQTGTWITQEILEAYVRLHEMGYAHSVEVWQGNSLAGGLYGVSLGGVFVGESMFSKVSNASKAGFILLAKTLERMHFHMLDCQLHTPHLASLGAREISRKQYLDELAISLRKKTLKGNWNKLAVVQEALASVFFTIAG